MEPVDKEKSCMSDKILTDIYNILYNDVELNEFCIVPMCENKNKSPVLYEEHNLGIESWCIKYVYSYLYEELLNVRKLLGRNKLPWCKSEKLDKLLIGALLINPEIQTFWNMRRELIDYGELKIDRELQFTQLVLSNRSKSNEAFGYRKWVMTKLLKNYTFEQNLILLYNEFIVCEKTAEKSQNNYHSWNYRVWCVDTVSLSAVDNLNLIVDQLDWSKLWIKRHVSEHAGYHYRQYLCNRILNNSVGNIPQNTKYYTRIAPHLNLSFNNDHMLYLESLLGQREYSSNTNCSQDKIKNYNYVYFLNILLYDLLYFIPNLNNLFTDHESMWYHRRYIIYNVFKIAYDFHQLHWKRNVKTKESDCEQKNSKLLKYESNKVESSYLYSIVIENERKFIKDNCSNKYCESQREYARRHEKWLRCVVGIESI